VPCYPASPRPVPPSLSFTECAPDMVCTDRPGAAALIQYLEALHRWLRDLDKLCDQQ
jgi:hypothetical protein